MKIFKIATVLSLLLSTSVLASTIEPEDNWNFIELSKSVNLFSDSDNARKTSLDGFKILNHKYYAIASIKNTDYKDSVGTSANYFSVGAGTYSKITNRMNAFIGASLVTSLYDNDLNQDHSSNGIKIELGVTALARYNLSFENKIFHEALSKGDHTGFQSAIRYNFNDELIIGVKYELRERGEDYFDLGIGWKF
jgi:hypothetical protein